ncbi:MAG: VanZ family protein [Phycisphaerales bacterium]
MINRAWRIVAFVLYALAVVTATHWPKLRIESDVMERPDILIHIGVFGLWALALLLSTLLRDPSRWRLVAKAWVISAGYAAADEITQAIPGIYRTAAWDDYAANLTGITLGCGVWLAGSWLYSRYCDPAPRSSAS